MHREFPRNSLDLLSYLAALGGLARPTFGTFSPTSSVPIVQAPGATNLRSYSPAAPIAATIGIRVTF